MIVTSGASGALASGANPAAPASMAMAIAGSAIFVALGASVAYSSHKRKSQKDWEVKVWRMNERPRADPKMPGMRENRNVEFH